MAIETTKDEKKKTEDLFKLFSQAGQSISQGITAIGTAQNEFMFETEMNRLERRYDSQPRMKFEVSKPSVPSGYPTPGLSSGFSSKTLIYGALGIGALLLTVTLLR